MNKSKQNTNFLKKLKPGMKVIAVGILMSNRKNTCTIDKIENGEISLKEFHVKFSIANGYEFGTNLCFLIEYNPKNLKSIWLDAN